MRELLRYL
jgi:hypothetical protein